MFISECMAVKKEETHRRDSHWRGSLRKDAESGIARNEWYGHGLCEWKYHAYEAGEEVRPFEEYRLKVWSSQNAEWSNSISAEL